MKRRLSKSLASTVITAICLAGTSASYAGAYRDAVLADGPVSYWTFSETDANDVATNIGLLAQSNLGDGTYSIDAMLGAPSLVAGEPDGSFFAAPGSNMVTEGFDKFSDVDGFGGTGFSVEFWTAAEQVSSGYANLVGDGTGGLDFNLMVYSGANGFIRPHMQTLENSYSSIDSTRLPAAGEIVHVVSTWDAETGDFNLYLDGALADTITSGGSLPNPGTPAWFDNPIFVGQDGREASPHAWIDEVAIYNYALSDTRVNLHYLAGQGAPSPLPEPPQPFSDPGNLAGLPDGLVTYIDFDESGAPGNGGILNYAYDRVGDNNGSFQGNATRVPGLIGAGAAAFDNTGGTQVVLGAGVDNSFSVVDGIALEALIEPDWTGDPGDYDEIFRKEDGGNRILFSFQNDSFGGGATPPVEPGPVLSFGLNVDGAYGELDMPLDVDLVSLDGGNSESGTIWLTDPGAALGPNDVVLRDGNLHHVAATYDAASGEKQIWIDGVMRWSVELVGDITSGGGAVASIGAVNGGENWNGIIDEFALWSRSLDASEIAEHYANVLAGLNYFGVGSTPGDLDNDGQLTLSDINLMLTKINEDSNEAAFDLNKDGFVDPLDVLRLVTDADKFNTYMGDANLDGVFDSSDFVSVFTAGQYEDGIDDNSTWETGDWNGDLDFDSSDFVVAFTDGGYEQGPRAAVSAVPEPATWLLALWIGLIAALTGRRRSIE